VTTLDDGTFMPRASRTCTLLVTALCAGVMLDAPPAGATSAAPAARSNATVTTLSKTVAYASLVTTDLGVSLAMWIPGSPTVKPTTRLEWAVQRPGQAWSTPLTLASSPPERLGALLPSGKVGYSTRTFGVFTLRVALDRIVVAKKGETKLLSLNGVQKQTRVLVK
jgi:hypothetical protein